MALCDVVGQVLSLANVSARGKNPVNGCVRLLFNHCILEMSLKKGMGRFENTL